MAGRSPLTGTSTPSKVPSRALSAPTRKMPSPANRGMSRVASKYPQVEVQSLPGHRPTGQNLSSGVLEDHGVRRLEVAGVAADGEGVPDPGPGPRLDQHRVATHRRRPCLEGGSGGPEVHDQPRRVGELHHPVDESFPGEDVDEHAPVWGAHDVEPIEQRVAQAAFGDGGLAHGRQRHAQQTALRACSRASTPAPPARVHRRCRGPGRPARGRRAPRNGPRAPCLLPSPSRLSPPSGSRNGAPEISPSPLRARTPRPSPPAPRRW